MKKLMTLTAVAMISTTALADITIDGNNYQNVTGNLLLAQTSLAIGSSAVAHSNASTIEGNNIHIRGNNYQNVSGKIVLQTSAAIGSGAQARSNMATIKSSND